ncbi:hypothetical protein [Streptomyces formicae]|uniref:Uncharacterized protein n=1 Tax=Streptomyces formicae TaxID=1616117 RepID=A0A291Q7X2_9ACTN|nr:hypothetical protein [Streptomyces formicae]ATL27595.1 hypothetical protein KY5_2577 [Streptomyces formicae]
MPCRDCAGHHPVKLADYPAGNPRASLDAAHRATEARGETLAPVHVHYDAVHDTFAVIRTDILEVSA